jgi:hypothetical protein
VANEEILKYKRNVNKTLRSYSRSVREDGGSRPREKAAIPGGSWSHQYGFERPLENGNVGNGKNAGKVGGDRVDGRNQAIAPLLILSAKALVDD